MPNREIVNFDRSEAERTETRVIALDIRESSFGFVVLEGATVLDCGTRSCEQSRSSDCLGERLHYILSIYKPSLVLLRTHSQSATRVRSKVTPAVLRAAAREAGVPILQLNSTMIRRFFLYRHARTKHEIALVVASAFPELDWKLPPKRKLWQSENARMLLFDAAAIVLVFRESQRSDPAQNQI